MGSATTPLWVTVLLAVLTPTLTLAGIFWTQRTADRRAEREADLRLRHERQVSRHEQLNELYVDILATAHEMIDETNKAERRNLASVFTPIYVRTLLIGPDRVATALEGLWKTLEDHRAAQDGLDGDPPLAPATDPYVLGEQIGGRMVALIEAIRVDTRTET